MKKIALLMIFLTISLMTIADDTAGINLHGIIQSSTPANGDLVVLSNVSNSVININPVIGKPIFTTNGTLNSGCYYDVNYSLAWLGGESKLVTVNLTLSSTPALPTYLNSNSSYYYQKYPLSSPVYYYFNSLAGGTTFSATLSSVPLNCSGQFYISSNAASPNVVAGNITLTLTMTVTYAT